MFKNIILKITICSLNIFHQELTIMDDDFGLDKTLGVQEVKLDGLPVDKEVRQAVQFGEVDIQ